MYHNIDKSALRRGEYVGHASGSWRIKRNGKSWQATANNAILHGDEPIVVFGTTLRDISEALEAVNDRRAKRMRSSALPNPFATVEA
jgi:hypothetical protein